MPPAPLLVGMGTHSPKIMDTSLLQQLLLHPQSQELLSHLDHCFCFIQKEDTYKTTTCTFSYHPSAISHPSVISSKDDVSHLLLIDSFAHSSLLHTYTYIHTCIDTTCLCVRPCLQIVYSKYTYAHASTCCSQSSII